MKSSPPSPFNWRSQPSTLADDNAFNGVDHRRSVVASGIKKTYFAIGSNDPRTPFNQVNTYGRAVVAKTKEAYKL